MALHLTGALDRAALTHSLAEIMRRHEALRTIFKSEAGTPFQLILRAAAGRAGNDRSRLRAGERATSGGEENRRRQSAEVLILLADR